MSTRALLYIVKDGVVTDCSYLHYGHVHDAGAPLLKYWNTNEKVKQLLKYGAMSGIEEYPFVLNRGMKDDVRNPKYADGDIEGSMIGKPINKIFGQSYIWNGKKWFCIDEDDELGVIQPLEKVVKEYEERWKQMGMKGCITIAPKRKRAAPKKRTPCVKVNVRRMF